MGAVSPDEQFCCQSYKAKHYSLIEFESVYQPNRSVLNACTVVLRLLPDGITISVA